MISFEAETIFQIGDFPITNAIIDTLLVDILILIFIVIMAKNISLVPSFFQNAVELLIGTFYDLTKLVAQERAGKIFPFFMSFFIFILLANWSELIPGASSIGVFHDKTLIPFLRSSTSDLNTTLAYAVISVVATHALSIQTLGIKGYLGRFFSLNPINLFVGLLEIVSEITKLVSLSFRLFGNIFAGGVLLGVVSGIFALIAPLPFLLLEIIVGLVQALIFAMLTMVFMAILSTPHYQNEHIKEVRR